MFLQYQHPGGMLVIYPQEEPGYLQHGPRVVQEPGDVQEATGGH